MLLDQSLHKVKMQAGSYRGGTMPWAPIHWGAPKKFQDCHNYFLQYSTFAPRKRRTCFLPRAPS